MKIKDIMDIYYGNQKYVFITKGEMSKVTKRDELSEKDLSLLVKKLSVDERTIYFDIY